MRKDTLALRQRPTSPPCPVDRDDAQVFAYFFGGALVRPGPEGFPVLEGFPPGPLDPPPLDDLLLISNSSNSKMKLSNFCSLRTE